MEGFESVFHQTMEDEDAFDTIFASQEDGELIDAVCGFNEAGECETDFDELHQTDDDVEPDDLEDELGKGHDTKNAPKGAEGTDTDPVIDLAMGEGCGDDLGSNQCPEKSSEADDFYKDDQDDPIGDGPDVHVDDEHIGDEFEDLMEAACGAVKESEDSDDAEKDDKKDDKDLEISDDMDKTMDSIEDDEDDDKDQEAVKESDEYEEGDADLVDLVAGNE